MNFPHNLSHSCCQDYVVSKHSSSQAIQVWLTVWSDRYCFITQIRQILEWSQDFQCGQSNNFILTTQDAFLEKNSFTTLTLCSSSSWAGTPVQVDLPSPCPALVFDPCSLSTRQESIQFWNFNGFDVSCMAHSHTL